MRDNEIETINDKDLALSKDYSLALSIATIYELAALS
jgi:hypothetical protein